MHRWSPRDQNSGNTNEILINHVFSVSSIVWKLNENEENHEFRSPFGVTISMKTVIFMKLTKCRHENPGGAQELRTVEIVMKTKVFEVVPRGPTGALQKF